MKFPVLIEVQLYEDGMLDQVYWYRGYKMDAGYEYENGIDLTSNPNCRITVYEANENWEIVSYFPIERW